MRINNAGYFIVAAAINIVLALSFLPAGAASANISHSYKAKSSIKNGSLVSLDAKQTDYVEAANVTNAERLLGVAVESNDSLLAVDPTAGQVQVATNGTANVLVSTLGGDIKVGDSIATSPFNGIGVKAEPGSRIVGLSQTEFSKNTKGATEQQVKDKSGKTQTIYVGFVRATVSSGTLDNGNNSLSTIQRLGRSLTGHTVSTARVLIALVIAVVAVAALVVLAYAAIYGTIVSIGRNPLAKYAIFRTLGTVLGMVTIIALVAGVTIYLLLT
jgi:hypothetical protein